MRSIAWLAEKGGVGKSTLAINTSVGLAKLGNRVLVIDGDAQANASMIFLKGRAPDAPTLLDVLTNEVEVSETILATDIPNLDLVPADGSLADANVLLAAELGRERRLRLAMQDVGESYDFVVVDAGPARSLLNVNILNFVGEIYAPVDPGIFALAGLMKLQEAVEGVVKFLDNSALKISGLVVNRVQRDNLSRDTEAQLRQAFGPLVMTAVIPASTKIGEASARYTNVLDYSPESAGAKAFEALTKEIMGHGQEQRIGNSLDGTPPADDTPAKARTNRRRRAG